MRRVSPVSIEKFEVSGTGRIVRVATNAYKPVTYLQSVLTMIKHNQNDSGAGNQFLSLLSLRYLAYLHPLFDIISLSFSSRNIFNLFFFLSRNGRIRNAAPSFLPENYPECESWSLTRLESRSQTGVTFPRRCGSFIGIVFPVLPLSQRERSPLLISCFSAHSDLKLNIRSWSWWVLDFKDTFEKMIKYRYKFFSLEIFGYFILFFFFFEERNRFE